MSIVGVAYLQITKVNKSESSASVDVRMYGVHVFQYANICGLHEVCLFA